MISGSSLDFGLGGLHMPEGHVTHRLAREITAIFGGRPAQVTSPQGRFAESAALLNEHVLTHSEAYGKNLFVAFDAPTPEPIIHIHLGLIGKLNIESVAEPTGLVRLRIDNGVIAADLRGPQTCELISPQRQAEIQASLGPDPIRPDADPQRGWARVHRSSKPIAALLMDQKITAGVGNIYRAEVLFRHRINPFVPGNKLKPASWNAIWADLAYLMPLGVTDGRIDTVHPEHEPEAMQRAPRVDRHGGEVYVYRRAGDACLVCGSAINTRLLEGRHLYWCGRCQRRH